MSNQLAKKKAAKRGRPTTGEDKMEVGMTLRVPKELREQARAKSHRTGISVSFVVRKRLEEWVADE
jgi:predicted HicB family RNase H-like nuclease